MPQQIQTNLPLGKRHVGMTHGRLERDPRRLVRVTARDPDVQLPQAIGVGGFGGPAQHGGPVEEVVVGQRAQGEECRGWVGALGAQFG